MIRTLLLLSFLTFSVFVYADNSVRIGILSFRSVEQTGKQWQPLADYLAREIPGKEFKIIPLYYPDLDAAATKKQVDFVLNNPEHYLLLRQATGMSAIATLMPLVEGRPVNQFGGVIFTKASNGKLNKLADLADAVIAATDRKSFGGFLMQDWELYKLDIEPAGFIFTGMPHDKVVEAVLADKADAGFVRTGIIEAMIKEGKIQQDTLKIINPLATNFPHKTSTELYPEWPFSAMPDTPIDLVKGVTLALLNLRDDEMIAKTAKIYGFSPPGDYAKVEAILLRLNIHPYELKNIQLKDVYFRYRYAVWAGAFLLLMIGLLSLQLIRANRRWRRFGLMYHLVADYTSDWEYWIGTQGELVYMSPACQNVTGYAPDDFQREPELLELMVHPDDKEMFDRHWRGHVTSRKAGELEFRILDRQGKARWIHHLCRPVFDHKNRYQGIRASNRDITARKDIEMELRLQDAALKACVDAILITNVNGIIQWVNPAFCKLTGYSEEEAVGRRPAELVKSGLQDETFYHQLWETILKGEHWRGEVTNRRKNGDLYQEQLSITPVFSAPDIISHFVAIKQDITERKKIEETIRQMAFYDPLTRLANRRLLVDRLEHAIAVCKRKQRYGALLLLDLDRFKPLNDLFGHDVGDQLLQEVAIRLTSLVRQQDTVARLGGDEFVVLLEELDSDIEQADQQAEQVANKIKEVISQPYQLEANRDQTVSSFFSYDLTVSIGLTLFVDAESSGEKILKQADMAMYQAKHEGRNSVSRFQPL